jgi:hypothetical protein
MRHCTKCNAALHFKYQPREEGRNATNVSKHDKLVLKFCDFYSFMSYSDFRAWVEADDDSAPAMSFARPTGVG